MAAFAFDLDGTICFDGQSIASTILDALEELASNHQIIIASARHPVNIRDVVPAALFARIDIVGANGAIAYAAGVRVHRRVMAAPVARSVLHTLEAARCAYFAYGEDFVIVNSRGMRLAIARDLGRKLRPGSDRDLAGVLKVLALPDENSAEPSSQCQALDGVRIERHGDGTFDVMGADVDKALGIRALIAADTSLFAAFGNDCNDEAMLELSRHAIVVGDHPSLLRIDRRHLRSGPDQTERIATTIRHLNIESSAVPVRTGAGVPTQQRQP
ncbi:HAD hydrolase family protein [Ensifer adhaerens]|uniref:HAD hydrolase family protein n=1 Tax=Ensifer adhaerens TaxID=106592 RepID=UPI003CFC4C7E